MNDDKTKPGESSKPSHEAAKVVIPFDIDISGIESKLAEIERRVSSITGKMSQDGRQGLEETAAGKMSPDGRQTHQGQAGVDSIAADSYEETQQKIRQERLIDIEEESQKEEEKNQTMMMANFARMNDLLRQINDVVLLIYTTVQNNRNA